MTGRPITQLKNKATDLNKHFTKEDIKMTNKQMKRYLP